MGAGERDRERERKKRRPNEGELGPEAELCAGRGRSAGTDGPLGVVADRTGWPARECETYEKEAPRVTGLEDDWLVVEREEVLSIGAWPDGSVSIVIFSPSLFF